MSGRTGDGFTPVDQTGVREGRKSSPGEQEINRVGREMFAYRAHSGEFPL